MAEDAKKRFQYLKRFLESLAQVRRDPQKGPLIGTFKRERGERENRGNKEAIIEAASPGKKEEEKNRQGN